MEQTPLDLVRGTLHLLILKTLTWGPMHGYAITAAIRRSTGEALLVEEGALYPALYRMEAKDRLTPEGRRRYQSEAKTWNAYSAAVAKLLVQKTAPGES